MSAHLKNVLGPENPPSFRPRAGVVAGPVFEYSFDPQGGVHQLVVPGLEAVSIGPHTVVDWAFYADGPAAVAQPHAALAVTVDVVLEGIGDESVALSSHPLVRDRYGFELTAQAQFDAKWSMPEQWNANTVSLEAFAGKTARVVVTLGVPEGFDSNGADIEGAATGFLQVAVREQVIEAGDAGPRVSLVDTRRGSHAGSEFSRGNTIPAVAVPHGFLFLTPVTDALDSRWPYKPYRNDADLGSGLGRRLQALAFSHQPSPWIGDRGVLHLAPFVGEPQLGVTERTTWVVPGTEVAQPHWYAAALDNSAHVEMTATSHVGLFRINMDDSQNVGFIIDQLTDDGLVEFSAEGSFWGWIPQGDAHWGNAPRTYFAGYIVGPGAGDGSVSGAGSGVDSSLGSVLKGNGRARVGGFVAARGRLEVRVAQSFISVEQALRSLELETPVEMSFDEIKAQTAQLWETVLSTVSLPALADDASATQRLIHRENLAKLFSSLYRIRLYPNTASENAGTNESPRWVFANAMQPIAQSNDLVSGAQRGYGNFVVNNGYWDTYRTLWPALSLLDPAGATTLLNGQLEQYRSGGYMARWSAPSYVDCMVGTSSDQIFADALSWGTPFAQALAFESAWKNACEPAQSSVQGRKGIESARFTGYVSNDVHEGMSWSLENAISDSGIALFAGRLANQSDDLDTSTRYRAFERYFANKALSYRTLFDPEAGFFRGRDKEGNFSAEAYDPRVWGGDNVETNGWGMSVTVPHDGFGLAALYGGAQGLGEHLDRLFAEPETADPAFAGSYGTVIHEQREARALRSGMCAISNQPAHHIPYMYAYTDRPWKAGRIVRELAGRLFSGSHIAQGFPGDEDNGEMSAWWLWAALGLYPLALGTGELHIGAPLFDHISVTPQGGQPFEIRTHRSSPTAHRLVRAVLDGVELDQPIINVERLIQGPHSLDVFYEDEGARPLVLKNSVSRHRAVPEYHPDLTAESGGLPVAGDGVAYAGRVFDDGKLGASAGVVLSRGQWVGWDFGTQVRITDVTVTTFAEAPGNALSWQYSHDGEHWITVSTLHTETLLSNRTTPFQLASPITCRAIRVVAQEPSHVRQLEFFDLP